MLERCKALEAQKVQILLPGETKLDEEWKERKKNI